MATGISLLLAPTYKPPAAAASTSTQPVAPQPVAQPTNPRADRAAPETRDQPSSRLSAPTLDAIFSVLANTNSLLKSLTPDALAGAASPSATAAPYHSGQNAAYDQVNGAFSSGAATQTPLGPTAPVTGGQSQSATTEAASGAVFTLSGLSLDGPSSETGVYTVTIGATNGTLGVPSSPSRGSLIQLIGTRDQVNTSLEQLDFQGSSPGVATVEPRSVSLDGQVVTGFRSNLSARIVLF